MENNVTRTKTLDKNRAAGVIMKDNKALLIHRIRDEKEYWVFPGGGIEEGESIEQALNREMMEELGIKINEAKFLFQIQDISRLEYYFLITSYNGEPKIGGPELERMNEHNQYILEEKDLSELSKINLLPKEAASKLSHCLKNQG